MGTHYKGSPKEVRALEAYIKLTRASESVNAKLMSQLSVENLTTSQFGTLEALYHLGPLCQKAIGQKILKSGGNITLVVDNLEKRGLVERVRNTDDRRFITVGLTAEGRALIERVFPEHAGRIVEVMKSLTAQEQDQLSALCKKLGVGLTSA